MGGTLPPLSHQLSPTLKAWTLTWKLSVKAETAFHEEMVGLRHRQCGFRALVTKCDTARQKQVASQLCGEIVGLGTATLQGDRAR